MVSFIENCLLSWTESPLERSAMALCKGEEEEGLKGPSGVLLDGPGWLL